MRRHGRSVSSRIASSRYRDRIAIAACGTVFAVLVIATAHAETALPDSPGAATTAPAGADEPGISRAGLSPVGAVAAVGTSAGTVKVGGSISMNTVGSSAFGGKVTSSRRFCRVKRLVVVKRVTPGKDPIIGRDRTNGKGRYLVDLPGSVTGTFYAQATRKLNIVSGLRVVCRRLETKSRTTTRPPPPPPGFSAPP